jgi:hypothetical protein
VSYAARWEPRRSAPAPVHVVPATAVVHPAAGDPRCVRARRPLVAARYPDVTAAVPALISRHPDQPRSARRYPGFDHDGRRPRPDVDATPRRRRASGREGCGQQQDQPEGLRPSDSPTRALGAASPAPSWRVARDCDQTVCEIASRDLQTTRHLRRCWRGILIWIDAARCGSHMGSVELTGRSSVSKARPRRRVRESR